MEPDLLVHNGTVLTVNDEFDIIQNGIVSIRGDRIEAVWPADPEASLPPADEYLDAGGGVIFPGLVNTHTHLPMSLFRGLADDLPLETWLNEHIFPAESAHVDPDTVYAGALLSCAELLLSGTTTCCDGYFYESRVADAVLKSGMRAVLGQGVLDFPAPGVPDPADNIKVAKDFLEKWGAVSSRIRTSVFCHSPYTCSWATLEKGKSAADEMGALFQIHAAETAGEAGIIGAGPEVTPIRYLEQAGILDNNTIIVHGVWATDRDIEILAKSGAAVSHNPESNMKLGSGIAPIPEMLDSGIPVGLGTDGCASNNDLDLLREMDTTAKLHKVRTGDPTVMDARSVFRMATRGGAGAIGWEKEIGSIESGKRADLVILETDRPHLTPIYNPVSHLVYVADGSDVRDVIVDGGVVVRDRRITTFDLDEAMARVNQMALRIKGNGTAGG